MTRCEICEAVLPEVIDPAFAEQGHRTIVWFGAGPHAFCKRHSFDELMVWIAETLVCDAEMARRHRERLALVLQGMHPIPEDGIEAQILRWRPTL